MATIKVFFVVAYDLNSIKLSKDFSFGNCSSGLVLRLILLFSDSKILVE